MIFMEGKRKKSILFVNNHLNVGGVERALVELLAALDYNKYDVDFLLLQDKGDYFGRVPEEVNILYYDTRKLEGPFWKNILSNLLKGRFSDVCFRVIQVYSKKYGRQHLAALRRLLPLREHYDAAIAFRHDQCAEIVAYSVDADKKFCWWHHGEINVLAAKVSDTAELFSQFDKVITVSNGCRRMIEDAFGLAPEKTAVIPNIIDVDYIRGLAGDEDPFGKDSRNRFVTLSRLSYEKHVENAVYAAEMLIQRGHNDFVWYIIGDGDKEAEINDLIAERGLGDYLVLTGKVANPYPYLRFAKALIHPSYVESQGIAVLEAMALCKPVVVTRSTGPEDYVVNDYNGIFVKKGAKCLAEGILRLLGMKSNDLKKLESNAFDSIKHNYIPEIVCVKFDELLNTTF